MDETPYRLAHEAALRAITDQASVIESLRSGAGTIFAATALVTSFLGGQAFTRITREGHLPPFHLLSASGGALLCFIALAALTFIILWPFPIRFSISSRQMIEIADERAEAAIPFLLGEVAAWLVVIYRAKP